MPKSAFINGCWAELTIMIRSIRPEEFLIVYDKQVQLPEIHHPQPATIRDLGSGLHFVFGPGFAVSRSGGCHLRP
jgi:hypothetical protein